MATARRSPMRRPVGERAPIDAVTRGLVILAIVWQALTMFPDPVFWPWRQAAVLDALILAASWGCWVGLVLLTVGNRRPTAWAVRLQALDAVLMLLAGLHLLTWVPVRLDDGWLAAASLVNLGVGLIGIALPLRWSIPLVIATVGYVTLRLATVGPGILPTGEALQYGLYALAVGTAVISSRYGLLKAAARSEQAQLDRERAVADADAAHVVQHRSVELTRLLHETVLNTLNAIVRGVPDTPQARARSAERCRQSLVVLQSLRDVALAGEPNASLRRAVEAEVTDLVSMGVEVTVDVDRPRQVPIAVRNAFTAVAREALINIARHARATRVLVTARADSDAWVLDIRDDGVGFDVANNGRLGLDVMRSSIESVGGVLAIRSTRDVGTDLEARIPRTTDISSNETAAGDAMVLPVLASFLGLSFVSLLGGWASYAKPGFAAAAFVVAAASSAVILTVARRRVLPWWVVIAAALVAPTIYHLQAAASNGSTISSWSEWASEFVLAMLFVVGAGGPPWAWLAALASWLVTQGDPLGELLQPGTAVIIAGALYARSVMKSNESYRIASRARLAQQAAERADEESTRRATRRFTELADSTATDLLDGLAEGTLDVLDDDVRRRCSAEERYIRGLMRIDPQRSTLDAMIMRLIRRAHDQGVILDVDVTDGVAIAEEHLNAFESSAVQAFGMIAEGEPVRLSVRREGGRAVLRLVASVQGGHDPGREAPTCLVLWDADSRSAMWEVGE